MRANGLFWTISTLMARASERLNLTKNCWVRLNLTIDLLATSKLKTGFLATSRLNGTSKLTKTNIVTSKLTISHYRLPISTAAWPAVTGQNSEPQIGCQKSSKSALCCAVIARPPRAISASADEWRCPATTAASRSTASPLRPARQRVACDQQESNIRSSRHAQQNRQCAVRGHVTGRSERPTGVGRLSAAHPPGLPLPAPLGRCSSVAWTWLPASWLLAPSWLPASSNSSSHSSSSSSE